MFRNWKIAVLAAYLSMAIGVVAFAQEGSVLVEPQSASPADGPAVVAPAPDTVESIPAPASAHETTAVVRPAPPIVSHASRGARRMYRCQQAVHLMMVTKNPADCCLYEIPLCVPACCVGEPTVTEGRGLLGRGVVEYCWSCGFTATVKFRPVLCDVKIRYDG